MKPGGGPRRVLVTDPISDAGVDLLRSTPGFEVDVRTDLDADALAACVGEYDGLVVRSGTRVTREILARPGRLRVIGRAGTGVDNIDLPAATRAGIVVLNTPGGNAVAAAEQTVALLTALARNVPQAHAALKAGRWDRKGHVGVELTGKTLGVVGLGRIGREVARRAAGLRMQVVGHDPLVTAEAAADMGVAYRDLPTLLAESDFVTLHVPLTPKTRHLLDADRIAAMKPGARLINCARGGLVDEAALLRALRSGHLAGAALDVFEDEPPAADGVVSHPGVVVTPHLGASTVEAQRRVGVEIAGKVRDYLADAVILDAVNFPAVDRETFERLGPLLDLAERLGRFAGQVADGGLRSVELTAVGGFVEHPLRPLAMAATRGVLSTSMREGLSWVNALQAAEERGITVEEGRSRERTPYAGVLRLTVRATRGPVLVTGTLGAGDAPRIVGLDDVAIEVEPRGSMLVLWNRDVPGVVGKLGTLLGAARINIAGLHVGRPARGDDAVSVVRVDGPIPGDVVASIGGIEEIVRARPVEI